MRAEANRGAPFDMRTIDIFVSSFPDVQKEHVVAGQLIRSAAAEFKLAINAHYSNPRRGSGAQGGSIGREDFAEESALVLSACFWEYPEREENDFLEIPNTGLYDLVICILGSRLGTTLAPQCVMPDGSRPRSATDYEVGWALYQSKLTPGCPGLHVYRSRAIPAEPLEPRERRENLLRPWDAMQEFWAAWEKEDGTGFRECCHDFQGLEEFEDLFRKHFREFLARRLNPAIPSGTLLPDSGSHLNETQIDYTNKSLARHKPGRKVPQMIGAAAIAGLAIFGAFVGGERFTAESRRTNKEHDIRPAQQNTDLDAPEPSQLEAKRSALELEKRQIAQQSADLAKSQRSGVDAELRKAQNEKAQLTQQASNLADNQRSAKKGTDSANELRSGRALTLDSPQNAEQGISTQGFTAPVQSPNR
jgi:hypothetical protein